MAPLNRAAATALLSLSVGAFHALPAQERSQPAPIRFTDVTAAAGVDFHHVKGGSGAHYFPEQFGPGTAILDYDGDGRLDVFFVQGAPLPGFTGSRPSGNALYRNNGDGTFADVTGQAGLRDGRYGLGAASADFDNDGDPDLFVTNLEGNALYRNDRGRFSDVTGKAGVSAPPMSTSAAFFDYDNDGWLDLFVARYLEYSHDEDLRCIEPLSVTGPVLFAERRSAPLRSDPTLRLAYCGPPAYKGTSNRLYRNNRDGTFTDVSRQSGIAVGVSHGLGVAVADFDGDGHTDVFVASDMMPNLLFMNGGDGTFREEALWAGVALGQSGKAYAGMGVDAADYDNDGRVDLFITNYEDEPSSLYRNNGDGTFSDESGPSGIAAISRAFLKWGCRFVDFDFDGYPDLFVVNGHVNDNLGDGAPAPPPSPFLLSGGRRPMPMPVPLREGYRQRAQVYRNTGAHGRFSDVSLDAGPFFVEKHAGRGAAFGDLDNDGDVDVVVGNNDTPAVLLRNDSARRSSWAGLELHGTGCNRDAVGARVRVTSGGVTQTRFVPSGGSYLSDHDRRLLVALPGASGRVTAEIRWPCGATEVVALRAGGYLTVQEARCRLPATRRPAAGR